MTASSSSAPTRMGIRTIHLVTLGLSLSVFFAISFNAISD